MTSSNYNNISNYLPFLIWVLGSFYIFDISIYLSILSCLIFCTIFIGRVKLNRAQFIILLFPMFMLIKYYYHELNPSQSLNSKDILKSEYLVLLASFFSIYLPSLIWNWNRLIRVYLYFALVISIIALIQQFAFFLNLGFLVDFKDIGFYTKVDVHSSVFRSTSIFFEPAHLGFFLLFPIMLSLTKQITISKYFRSCYYLAFLFTFSIGSYLNLAMLYTMYMVLSRRLRASDVLMFVFVIILVVYSLFNVPIFYEKVILGLSNPEESGSFFAIYSIIMTSWYAFLDNPIMGTGVGSKFAYYQAYFFKAFDFHMSSLDYRFIIPDENYISKFLAEFGLLGISSLLLVTYLNWTKSTVIQKIALASCFLISIKSGSYFNPGVYILFCIYLMSPTSFINND